MSNTRYQRGRHWYEIFGALLSFLALILPLIVSCTSGVSELESLVLSLDQAIMDGDVKSALKLFSDDATLEIEGSGTFTGKERLEAVISRMTPIEGSTCELSNFEISGDNISWIREVCDPDEYCVDDECCFKTSNEAIIKDGVISSWYMELIE